MYLSRIAVKIIKSRFGHLGELFFHQRSAKKNSDQSFGNEVEVIRELLGKMKITVGYAVDMAASDGLSQSCTYPLYKDHWAGLCVEMDPIKFSKLSFLYREFMQVSLAKIRVTPLNIKSTFDAAETPKEFEFLNLDIDSYDLRVIESMLEQNYRPKLISMEINEKIPPGIFFTVEYDESHYWQGDHFYGCSIGAACAVLSKFDYVLVKQEWNNVFFVRSESAYQSNLTVLQPHEAFNSGYRDRVERNKLFPWNNNVENWLFIDPSESQVLICNYFSNYDGKYTCKLID